MMETMKLLSHICDYVRSFVVSIRRARCTQDYVISVLYMGKFLGEDYRS
jgi:hypothetical protein